MKRIFFLFFFYTLSIYSTQEITEDQIKQMHAFAYQANQALKQGHFTKAEELYKQALVLAPKDPRVNFNLGLALLWQEKLEAALAHFNVTLELDPWHSNALLNKVKVLFAQKKYKDSYKTIGKLLHLQPYNSDALKLATDCLQAEGKARTAIANCRKTLSKKPNDFTLKATLADLLNQHDEKKESIQLYLELLEDDPHSIPIMRNIAHILKDIDSIADAKQWFKKIISYKPESATAHAGLAQCYLTEGKLQKGFNELEYRGPDIHSFKSFDWSDSEIDLSGKKILLRCEWGLGDCIQFIRYAQLIKQRGGHVIVQTYDALIPLFSRCPFIDKVVTTNEEFPKHDIQIPLLSLAKTFGTTLKTIPSFIPYLSAKPQLVAQWAKQFDTQKINIGICWHGNGSTNTPPSLNKNIPVKYFEQLAKLPNVQLYSLQKITGLNENENNLLVINFKEDFDTKHGSFMDTAAIMKHLDVVITADTSIAHLAGALGVPTWIALPYKADWRWMQNRDDSPWYPTVQLFKQTEPGNWNSVIQAMKEQLLTWNTKQNS